MKTPLIALLCIIGLNAFAHDGVELGPNGGRILEFSKNETMHGEVTVKAENFHIALLDKDMKPVPVGQQMLTATLGDRKKPQKLPVEKTPDGFTTPLVPPGQWLILQYKETPASKAITARFEYNTDTCGGCNKPEWLCACPPKK